MPVLGRTLWNASSLGFGCYRISERDPEHRRALELALASGCNVIDTSTNYGDGSSERLVGQTLAGLIQQGRLGREQVFVVSKAGYVQGSNLETARKREAQGRPYAEMVKYSDDCWHCISPGFLEEQLSASLERLGLERLDALLLHNPEYFLKAGGEHAEYYRRIEAAFAQLEKEVERGRIRYYGISSNTFPESRDADDYTSLEATYEIAEKFGAHHFALVQLPFNLFEPGAALEINNGSRTVLEYAREKGLGTLINRPLNAFARSGLIRLADFPSHDDQDIVGDFKEAMTAATALEASYPGKALVPARQIAWGHLLRENFTRLSDLDTWKGMLAYRIEPTLGAAFELLEEHEEFRGWVADYRKASARLFEVFSVYLENQASVKSDQIAGMLDHLSLDLQSSKSLSQKAIRVYRSIPGVDCVLVGMRQTQYVRDLMDLQSPIDAEAARRALLEVDRMNLKVSGAL